MQLTLYSIPASNAVLAAQLALDHMGAGYRRVDQLPVLHRVTMRLRGFDGSTVPGLAVSGRKVHGSPAILRALHELNPAAGLYPNDPARRRAVEEAVAWGEEVYQPLMRTLLPYSLLRRPRAVPSVLAGAHMSVPAGLVAHTSKPAIYVNSLLNGSNEAGVRRALAQLPELVAHVDDLIGRGVLDGGDPGAADFMIAPTSRALLWWDDLRPLVEGHPAADHARRIAPRYDASIPPVFPRDALPATG